LCFVTCLFARSLTPIDFTQDRHQWHRWQCLMRFLRIAGYPAICNYTSMVLIRMFMGTSVQLSLLMGILVPVYSHRLSIDRFQSINSLHWQLIKMLRWTPICKVSRVWSNFRLGKIKAESGKKKYQRPKNIYPHFFPEPAQSRRLLILLWFMETISFRS